MKLFRRSRGTWAAAALFTFFLVSLVGEAARAEINPWVAASVYDARRWDTGGPFAATPWLHPPNYTPEMGWGMLDPEQAIESGDWKKMSGLTGSWGGARSKMRESGFSLDAAYFGQLSAKTNGGTRAPIGVSWRGDLAVAAFADLGRIAGWDGTYFTTSANWKAGNPSLTFSKGHPERTYLGNTLPVQLDSFQDPNSIRLIHLAVGKALFENTTEFIAGRLVTGDDFATLRLACTSLNQAVCGNPIAGARTVTFPSFPTATWGGVVKYKPQEQWIAQVGSYLVWSDMRNRNNHGVEFGAPEGSGVLTIAQLEWSRGLNEGDPDMPGTYRLGGYYDTESLPRFGGSPDEWYHTSDFWSVYLMGQQMVWSENGSKNEGISIWGSLSYAPPDKNLMDFMVVGGVLYQGFIPGRPYDGLAFTAAYGSFSSGASKRPPKVAAADFRPGQFETGELLLELNYRLTVGPWLWIEPDIQGILWPSGNKGIGDALIVGIALGVVF